MTCHLLQSQEPEEGNPRQSSHSGPRKRECRSRCGFQSKGKRWLSWQEDSRKSISIHQLPFGVLLCVLLTPSCLILCNPMDCSLPGSFVYGILQARILEWVTIPFSKGSSGPRDRTQVSSIADEFFTTQPAGKPPKKK